MTPDSVRYRSSLPGFSWPAIPGTWAANKLALLFQVEQNQWRAPQQIESSQFEQLGNVLAFAARTVPHYRRQLGSDFPGAKISPQTWREIPVLTRKDAFHSAAELKSGELPREHGRTYPLRTSGSTGMVVELLGTDLTNLFWQVFCLRDHLWHRRDLREKLCGIRFQRDAALRGRAGVYDQGWGVATDDFATTGTSVSYDILQDVAYLAERLAVERPGYLLSHPSLILGLARHCLDRHILLPGLKEVRTLGETPDEALRELCHRAWNVPMVDIYTCQEAGYLALQCPEHAHYHVQAENVFLEVVDERGRACKPGEIGRVLVTSLNNFATPLIRYELGDYAEVGEPCPCGRGLPVLKRIMGRYRNLLTLPDGSRRWALIGFPTDIAPIEEMQIVQTALHQLQVRLVMPRALDDAETGKLSAYIRNNTGYPFELSFQYVDRIRDSANGKVEQVISLVAAER